MLGSSSSLKTTRTCQRSGTASMTVSVGRLPGMGAPVLSRASGHQPGDTRVSALCEQNVAASPRALPVSQT